MDTLEQEIISKFQQLTPDAKRRVLDTLTNTPSIHFDYEVWWADVAELQADIQARLGKTGTVGALSLLEELREETS